MKNLLLILSLFIGVLSINAQTQAFKKALFNAYVSGSADDQYIVAQMYHDGKEVQPNFTDEFNWYKKAAEKGHIKAALCLGEWYWRGVSNRDGKLLNIDNTMALYYFEKAANSGSAEAYNYMARIYSLGGDGVAMDKTKALFYAEKSANLGYIYACNNLGRLYYNGSNVLQEWDFGYRLGVQQNFGESFKWYQKGANLGDADAMNVLAYHYAKGLGVQKNIKMAHQWIDRAIAKYPQNASLLDSKGEFYLMQGDRINARRMYDRCLQVDSNWGNLHTELYQGLFER